MQIIRTVSEMQRLARAAGRKGSVGLVPTMGALHEGHLSLVRRARVENDRVTATIFVNPLQFGANEDLDKYPRTFEADCAVLEQEGVDFLFAPIPEEMYPRQYGLKPETMVDPGKIATRLDGASRPGHFVGVATVVAKLFHVALPDKAYFGQKDAVQLAIIRQMVRELNFPVEVVACSIVRDKDGLALSSRNRYLSEKDRESALILCRTLAALRDRIGKGIRDSGRLRRNPKPIRDAGPNFRLEYLAIVDPDTLWPVPEAVPGTLIAIAAKVGTTRLIDNCLVS
jgi:pantoate--beta-alanine ligase